MSHVVAISIETDAGAVGAAEILYSAGFAPLELTQPQSSPVLAEVAHVARSLKPSAQWFVARDGEDADLGFVHRLANSFRNGSLGPLVSTHGEVSLHGIGVLLYDLADDNLTKLPIEGIDRLVQTIIENYPHGGPPGTVFHEFRRVLNTAVP